jgi:uncharacterized membrane protein YphA (DoxX/SURF4 family)
MSAGITTPTGAKTGRLKTVALWMVTVLLACLFLFAGSMKFVSPEAARGFAEMGFPDWFRVLIAVVEIGGAVALLVPRTAVFGAAALAVVMVGAVGTLLTHGAAAQALVPAVVLVLLVLVGYARRPRTAR